MPIAIILDRSISELLPNVHDLANRQLLLYAIISFVLFCTNSPQFGLLLLLILRLEQLLHRAVVGEAWDLSAPTHAGQQVILLATSIGSRLASCDSTTCIGFDE